MARDQLQVLFFRESSTFIFETGSLTHLELELTEKVKLTGQQIPRICQPGQTEQACTNILGFFYMGSGDGTIPHMLMQQAFSNWIIPQILGQFLNVGVLHRFASDVISMM